MSQWSDFVFNRVANSAQFWLSQSIRAIFWTDMNETLQVAFCTLKLSISFLNMNHFNLKPPEPCVILVYSTIANLQSQLILLRSSDMPLLLQAAQTQCSRKPTLWQLVNLFFTSAWYRELNYFEFRSMEDASLCCIGASPLPFVSQIERWDWGFAVWRWCCTL